MNDLTLPALFIYFCAGSLLLHVNFSLIVASEGYSLLWCIEFSLWWLLLLWSTGSRVCRLQ